MKERSPSETGISISMPKQLLAEADRRAKALGMKRSEYLQKLIRNDLIKAGVFGVVPDPRLETSESYPEYRDRSQLAADAPLQPGTPLHNPQPASYKAKPKKAKS